MVFWRKVKNKDNTKKEKNGFTYIKLFTTIFLLALCAGIVVLLVHAYCEGDFNSAETLQKYISGFGILAPVVLIFIQAMQVIIPVLPGFLGCAVGSILFGCAGGFVCNYVGISLGSIIAFFLARVYGYKIVASLFKQEKFDKWSTWAAKSKSYTALLFLGMVLPLFPDDFFCYFTGLTKMTVKKFVLIIIIGKPWCILAYSIGFSFIK